MIPVVPSSRFVKNAEVRKVEKDIKNRGKRKNVTFQFSAEVGKWERKGCAASWWSRSGPDA